MVKRTRPRIFGEATNQKQNTDFFWPSSPRLKADDRRHIKIFGLITLLQVSKNISCFLPFRKDVNRKD